MVLGHANGEVENHLWIQYLLRCVLHGRAPFFHDDVTLGEVIRLYPTDLVVRFPAALVGAVVGDTVAFNLFALAQVGFAGWVTVALARELGAGRWPSVVAGLVVMLHPGYLGFLACGMADSLSLGWLLLVFLMWRRLVRVPGRGAGLRLGLSLGLLVGANPNLAYLAVWPVTGLSALALFRGWRRLIGPLAIAAGTGAALAGCFVGLMVWVELGGERNSRGRLSSPRAHSQSQERMLRPVIEWVTLDSLGRDVAHFDRKASRYLQRERISGSWYEVPDLVRDRFDLEDAPVLTGAGPWALGGLFYIALVPLALLLVGVVLSPRKLLPWLAIYVVLQVLALGSGSPHADPWVFPGQEQRLVIRVDSLFNALPGGSHFLNFALFNSLAAAALGLAAALVLTSIARAGWRRWMLGCTLLLWLLEVQLISPTTLPLVTTRLDVPAGAQQALRRGKRGVVVLPKHNGRAGYLMRFHGRHTNIIWNQQHRRNPSDDLIDAFVQRRESMDARAVLKGLRADTVVLFTSLWPRVFAAEFLDQLQRDLGPPAWRDPRDRLVIFVVR